MVRSQIPVHFARMRQLVVCRGMASGMYRAACDVEEIGSRLTCDYFGKVGAARIMRLQTAIYPHPRPYYREDYVEAYNTDVLRKRTNTIIEVTKTCVLKPMIAVRRLLAAVMV